MFAAISLSLGCVYACLFLCHFGLWLNTLCLDFNSFYFSQMPNYVHIKCHQPIQHGHLKAKEVSYGKQYSKMYYSCDYICHRFGGWISIKNSIFLGLFRPNQLYISRSYFPSLYFFKSQHFSAKKVLNSSKVYLSTTLFCFTLAIFLSKSNNFLIFFFIQVLCLDLGMVIFRLWLKISQLLPITSLGGCYRLTACHLWL